MSKTTFGDLKASRIPTVLNLAPTDQRVLDYANECTRRLLTRGLYWGSYGTFDVAVNSQLITLPPQLETLETCSIGRVPIPIRDSFYQFIDSGWGVRDETQTIGTGIMEALYLSNYPLTVDVASPASVLKVQCDLATDVGKIVILYGYDSNSNWVRRQVSGVYQDGEQVTLAQSPGTNTVTQFSRITDVQVVSAMDGQWWLYQGTTLLSNYQFWETHPSYKRYLVPTLPTNTTTARVIGRRAFVPIKNDTDTLILGNLAAMKLGMLACKFEDEMNFGVAMILWEGGKDKNGRTVVGALQELDSELQFQLGVGRELTISVQNSSPYANDPVYQLE